MRTKSDRSKPVDGSVPGFPFTVTPALAAKIGSILVHVEEAAGPGGHPFDTHTAATLLAAPDVQAWLEALRKMSMVPVKRRA